MDKKYILDDEIDQDIQQFESEDPFDDEEIEIEDSKSQLASTPRKNILILIIFAIVAVVFLYNVVFKKSPDEVEKKKIEKIVESQPEENATEPTPPVDERPFIETQIEAPDLPIFDKIESAPLPTGIPEVPKIENKAVEQIEDLPFDPSVFTPPAETTIKNKVVTASKLNTKSTEDDKLAPPPFIEEKPKADLILVDKGDKKGLQFVAPTPEQLAVIKATKRKQPMVVTNGGGVPTQAVDSNGGLVSGDTASTSAEKATATNIGDTDYLIAQGKTINAVLETAINTSLEGMIRAIISRDVYAESGRNILLPKGTRLIGQYSAATAVGQERVLITWKRAIRPDGVDIAIESPGTDQMGRSGVTGFVDNRYFDIISNSILLSAVTIGGSILVDKITDTQQTTTSTTTNTDGSTTSTSSGTATDAAVLSGVEDLGSIAGKIAGSMLDDRPIIIVQQGELINVFVNRDLHFPPSTTGNTQFVN
jgi:type IV secretion system protein VirB10